MLPPLDMHLWGQEARYLITAPCDQAVSYSDISWSPYMFVHLVNDCCKLLDVACANMTRKACCQLSGVPWGCWQVW